MSKANSFVIMPPFYVLVTLFYNRVTFSSQNVYSTTEQVVGTWIDGEPIYRKVIVKSDGISSGENNIAHNINNLGQVIGRDISFYNSSSGDSFLIPAFNTVGTRQEMSGWTVSRTSVKIFSTFNYNNPLYITLEYTKTS